MVGEGKIAEMVHAQMRLAKRKYLAERRIRLTDLDLHEQYKSPQLRLF